MRSPKPGSLRRSTDANSRGRPAVHTEPWSKVTVVLFNRQIANVDGLIAHIRGRTGATLSRTLVIRSLIDALLSSGVDVSDCRNETDFRDRITNRLKARRRSGRHSPRKSSGPRA